MLSTELKFKVNNTLNYNHNLVLGECNKKPSMTIPDQTMSIREILVRYAKGLPIEAGKVPIYEGEEYTPDPRYMDLADRQEYMEYAMEQIKNVETNEVETPKNEIEENGQVS